MKTKLLIVNLITSIRAIGILSLIPVFILYGGIPTALLSIFCLSTDLVDGYLARKWKVSTFFGSLYDGVTDKGYGIISLLLVISKSPLGVIPLFLELLIMSVNIAKYKNNQNVKSYISGKVKTWFLFLTIISSFVLIDITKFNLSQNIIEKINDIYAILYTLLMMSEINTLQDYTKSYQKEFKTKEELEIERIKEEKEELIKQRNEQLTLKEMLFSPKYYEENKNESILKLMRKVKK